MLIWTGNFEMKRVELRQAVGNLLLNNLCGISLLGTSGTGKNSPPIYPCCFSLSWKESF